MGVKILALVLTLLVFHGVECISPPKVDGSFIAWGEIVQPFEDQLSLQISFEESYDADSKNAAFFLWFGGKNITFLKTDNPSQTFMYVETDKKITQCMETSETEWVESDFESSLLAFEDDEGKVKFSLNQLFDIPEKYLSEKGRGLYTVYRGIPASSWTYEYKSKDEKSGNDITLTITSYWADGTFDTSAGRYKAPLGFNLSRLISSKPVVVEDYTINVYGFVPNAYDHKYFKAVEGVVCDTRKQTLKFPNVKEIRAISIRTEMALPDYQELRYFDTFFDPVNKLLRVDIERMKEEDPVAKFKKYQSEVALGKMGVVFRYGYYKGESSCKVVPFDKYENDLQNLFDITQTQWNMGKLFGLNDTSYTYIGKTTKNDIPCHVFQGKRTDWPDKASNITSLWEWCFNVNMSKVKDIMMFQNDEFGMVSAQVKILSSGNKIYDNYSMNFHFYEVNAEDPKILSSRSFDIGKCFNATQKTGLQFSLNVTLDHNTKLLAENATSDIDFLQKLKSAIYTHSQVQDYSLRISYVRSTIEGDKIYVKFDILDVHNDLPGDIKRDMISLSDAEKNLRDSIDAGNVSIIHEWKKGERVTFSARKDSLEYQIDPNLKPQTLPPPVVVPTTQSTILPFSLKTDDPPTGTGPTLTPETDEPLTGTDSTNTTFTSKTDQPLTGTVTTVTPVRKRIQKFTGNQPGAVAGVSIAMLLVGMSVGLSGTFYKFNGLPRFLRR